MKVLLTGAAGTIGSVLRSGLCAPGRTLRLLDREPIDAGAGEEVVTADLTDPAAALAAVAGCQAVVHLAGIPTEDTFPALLDHNVRATWHVLEAARRQGARRVVFASSNHATGMHHRGERVGPATPPRPDSFYGVSKVAGEALGALYADKFGLEVVCVRIGSFTERPTQQRHLSTWLSHRDGAALFERCLVAPVADFTIVYGVSANTRGWWDGTGQELGYVARDDAEAYADQVGPDPEADVDEPGRRQGGEFVTPAFTLDRQEPPARS